jgi:RapZ-like N-terminal domain
VARATPTTGTADARGADAPARADAARSDGHLLVISGLSGAGKSQASKLFEDLGYYCVDNLPPRLLDEFLALRDSEPDQYRRTALVLDIRAGDPAPAVQRAMRASSAASPRRATAIRSRRRAAASRLGSPRSDDGSHGSARWRITSSTRAGCRSGS